MAYLKLAYYLLLEYILTIRLYIQALFKKHVPTHWRRGDKGDVILIPGYSVPWNFMEQIADALNHEGYTIHVVSKLSHTTLPILRCAEVLHTYISDNHLTDVLIVSFSKGGLVAKTYIDRYAAQSNVKKIISISTPYGGTKWGYLHLFNLNELATNSEVIKKMLEHTANNKKIINIYPNVDNHIIPNKNAILPGALVNEEIDIIGHTRILFDERLIESIKKYL